MKYIKTFEKLDKNRPKVGDYVIMKRDDAFKNFSSNNIGQIIEYDEYRIYKVKYDTDVPYHFNSNAPDDKKKYISKGINVRNFYKHEIDKWSNDKEELELILTTKNYNL